MQEAAAVQAPPTSNLPTQSACVLQPGFSWSQTVLLTRAAATSQGSIKAKWSRNNVSKFSAQMNTWGGGEVYFLAFGLLWDWGGCMGLGLEFWWFISFSGQSFREGQLLWEEKEHQRKSKLGRWSDYRLADSVPFLTQAFNTHVMNSEAAMARSLLLKQDHVETGHSVGTEAEDKAFGQGGANVCANVCHKPNTRESKLYLQCGLSPHSPCLLLLQHQSKVTHRHCTPGPHIPFLLGLLFRSTFSSAR